MNIARRMEYRGEPGPIDFLAQTAKLSPSNHSCEYHGKITRKGKHEADMS